MAKKAGSRTILLPIVPGKDETLRQAAERLGRVVSRWRFKDNKIKPSSFVVKLVGSSRKNRSLHDAFIEDKAAHGIGDASLYSGDEQVDSAPNELGILPRGTMFVDGWVDTLWKTEKNRREFADCDEEICWRKLPDGAVDRVSDQLILKEQWEEWAADFLEFASRLVELRARRKIAPDPDEEDGGISAECKSRGFQLSAGLLDERLLAAAGTMKASRGRYVPKSCGDLASGLGIKPSTVRAFLLQAVKRGWIQKFGKTKAVTYGLTGEGRRHVEGLSGQ